MLRPSAQDIQGLKGPERARFSTTTTDTYGKQVQGLEMLVSGAA